MKIKLSLGIAILALVSVLLGACASAATPQAAQPPPTNTAAPALPTATQAAPVATDTPAPTTAPTEAPVDPTLEPVSEAEPFKAWLSENIASRNYEELQKLMGSDFYFGMLQSEAGKETPENAIRLLQGFIGDNNISFTTAEEAATLLDFDPLSILSPEVKKPDVLLMKDAGTEGKDGAILYIAQKPDGSYYWYGLLVARGGFYR